MTGRQRARRRINGENVQMVVPADAGEPDRVFAGEIGAHSGHVQAERAAHHLRQCAGILIDGKAVNRQESRSLARVQKLSSSIHRQNMGEIKIESGER